MDSGIVVKRQRLDFTDEMRSVLEEAWNNGMTSAGKKCQEKILAVSNSLNLSRERVENWIGNRRMKEKNKGTNRSTSSSKTQAPLLVQGPNAYSYFISTLERGSVEKATFLRMAAQKWKELTPEQRKTFADKAAVIREDPLKGLPRDAITKQQLKIISNACEVLRSVGVVVGGIAIDKKLEIQTSVFGTEDGISMIAEKREEYEKRFHIPSSQPKPSKQDMRTEARKKFNSCWEMATGGEGKVVPYRSIREGLIRVKVHGLPDGVLFQDPSAYGMATLEKITKADIYLEILSDTERENPPSIVGEAVQDPGETEDEVTTICDKPPATTPTANTTTATTCNSTTATRETTTVDRIHVDDKNADTPTTSATTSTSSTDDITTIDKTDVDDKNPKCRINSASINADKAAKQLSEEQVDLLSPLILDSLSVELDTPLQEEVYEIEEIMKTRGRGKYKQCFVKWKGYEEKSWIPATDIIDK